jgi:hypothetical protein
MTNIDREDLLGRADHQDAMAEEDGRKGIPGSAALAAKERLAARLFREAALGNEEARREAFQIAEGGDVHAGFPGVDR